MVGLWRFSRLLRQCIATRAARRRTREEKPQAYGRSPGEYQSCGSRDAEPDWSDPLATLDAAKRAGRDDQVFWIAVKTIFEQLAVADGHVSVAEIFAARKMFLSLSLSVPQPEAWRASGRLQLSTVPELSTNIGPFAECLDFILALRRSLMETVFELLERLAEADGPVNAQEERFLAHLARRWRVQGRCPYAALGVAPEASDDEFKAAYRNLVKENHPDRFTGEGASPEAIAQANRRLTEINNAWARIKRERRL